MLSLICKAITAVYRTVVAGLERNFAGSSAFCAHGIIHLSVAGTAAGIAFAGVTARFAALGFIGETFFGEKFLFAGSKSKFAAAVFASKSFVVVHEIPLF
jgi:hypothetical protein